MTDLPLWRVTYENTHTENSVSTLRTVYVRAGKRSSVDAAFRHKVGAKHFRLVKAERA